MLQTKLPIRCSSVYVRSMWCASRVCVCGKACEHKSQCDVSTRSHLWMVKMTKKEKSRRSWKLEAYLWKLFVYVMYMFRSGSFFFCKFLLPHFIWPTILYCFWRICLRLSCTQFDEFQTDRLLNTEDTVLYCTMLCN